MHPQILSIATAVPPHVVDLAAALELARSICCSDERQERVASVLYRHSGIDTRYTVLPHTEAYRYAEPGAQRAGASPNYGPSTARRMAYYQEHALPLAVDAARRALEQSGCQRRDITHVVTASCTGFYAPGVDCGLIERLDLRHTTERVHVGYMGCHAAINALRAARGLALTDPHARVLVCCVELCSLHYSFHWDNERMLGNALFADGAAAAVVACGEDDSAATSLKPPSNPPPSKEGARGGIESPDRDRPSPHLDSLSNAASTQTSPNALRRWRLAATASFLFPGTTDAMTWNIGDHGFVMTISSELPRLISQNLAPWLAAWLAEHGLAPDGVASWAVHPGGPRIVEAAESALSIPSAKTQVSREILAAYGNMSSATVLFILERLAQRRAAAPCVMLAFGPGLVAEAALLL
ncbi:MAG: type III polyketide synthase [Pirellulales bacterium]|nr:type III polyketide synthase [Pirellulales bacterium]